MRYRTKKYIWKSVKYTVFTIAIVSLYITVAHRRNLPAVFEYYTGDLVRNATRELYLSISRDRKVETEEVKVAGSSGFFWDALDFISGEDSYWFARGKLSSLQQSLADLPENRSDFLDDLSSAPELNRLLRDPKGKFAEVYRYEFLERMERYPFVTKYSVYDPSGNLMFSSKNGEVPLKKEDETSPGENGFQVKVNSGERVEGIVSGEWNLLKFPDLPFAGNMGRGARGIIIDESGTIIAGSPGDPFFRDLVKNGVYEGGLGGRYYPRRILSRAVSGGHIIVFFPAAGFGWYLFRFLLLLTVLSGIWILSDYIRSFMENADFSRFRSRSRWLDESLKEAVELGSRTQTLALASVEFLARTKEQENKRLEAIVYRLARIEKVLPEKLQDAAERKASGWNPPQVSAEMRETEMQEEASDVVEEVSRMRYEPHFRQPDLQVEAEARSREKEVKPAEKSSFRYEADEEMNKVMSINSMEEWTKLQNARYSAADLPEPTLLNSEYSDIEIVDETEYFRNLQTAGISSGREAEAVATEPETVEIPSRVEITRPEHREEILTPQAEALQVPEIEIPADSGEETLVEPPKETASRKEEPIRDELGDAAEDIDTSGLEAPAVGSEHIDADELALNPEELEVGGGDQQVRDEPSPEEEPEQSVIISAHVPENRSEEPVQPVIEGILVLEENIGEKSLESVGIEKTRLEVEDPEIKILDIDSREIMVQEKPQEFHPPDHSLFLDHEMENMELNEVLFTGSGKTAEKAVAEQPVEASDEYYYQHSEDFLTLEDEIQENELAAGEGSVRK